MEILSDPRDKSVISIVNSLLAVRHRWFASGIKSRGPMSLAKHEAYASDFYFDWYMDSVF